MRTRFVLIALVVLAATVAAPSAGAATLGMLPGTVT
jgi:hypothetical protein